MQGEGGGVEKKETNGGGEEGESPYERDRETASPKKTSQCHHSDTDRQTEFRYDKIYIKLISSSRDELITNSYFINSKAIKSDFKKSLPR